MPPTDDEMSIGKLVQIARYDMKLHDITSLSVYITSLSVLVHVLPLRSRKLRWQHNQYPIQSPRQFPLDTYAVMQFTIPHNVFKL